MAAGSTHGGPAAGPGGGCPWWDSASCLLGQNRITFVNSFNKYGAPKCVPPCAECWQEERNQPVSAAGVCTLRHDGSRNQAAALQGEEGGDRAWWHKSRESTEQGHLTPGDDRGTEGSLEK